MESEEAIGDDAPTFWRARWREEHGTTQQTDKQLKQLAAQRTLEGRHTQTDRSRESPPMTAQQTADAEERAIADGYRKVDGKWRKR